MGGSERPVGSLLFGHISPSQGPGARFTRPECAGSSGLNLIFNIFHVIIILQTSNDFDGSSVFRCTHFFDSLKVVTPTPSHQAIVVKRCLKDFEIEIEIKLIVFHLSSWQGCVLRETFGGDSRGHQVKPSIISLRQSSVSNQFLM